MSDITQKAIEAFKTGQDLSSVTENEITDNVEETPSTESTETNSDPLSFMSDSEKEVTNEDQETNAENEVTEEEATEVEEEPKIEYVSANGKKIKVDYSDKDRIKKAYQMAAGMRKFQRERDDARKQLDGLTTEVKELKELWAKIEDAANRDDYNELTKIMTGGKVDFDTIVEQRLERNRLREDATEEELAKMDLEEKIARLEKQQSKQAAELKAKLEEAQKNREEAELKAMEGKINPVFDKYRFHGKMGDADLEQRMDEMLWTSTLNKLEDYDNLTSDIIAKEFRKAASILSKAVDKQVTNTTKKISKNRQRAAKSTAQIQQVKSYADSDLKKEAADKIRSGDLTSILKGWDKFGGLFN